MLSEDLCCSNLLWATQSWHGRTLGMSVGLPCCHGVMGYFTSLRVKLPSGFSHLTPKVTLTLHCAIPQEFHTKTEFFFKCYALRSAGL